MFLVEDTMHQPCPEQRLVSALVADAICDGKVLQALDLSKLETQLYGVGICHCPNCGRILGAFPPGFVRGWRWSGPCRHCEKTFGAPMDRILFHMSHGRVRSSYYGCGHEYRHGPEEREIMEWCPACTGEAPPLLQVRDGESSEDHGDG